MNIVRKVLLEQLKDQPKMMKGQILQFAKRMLNISVMGEFVVSEELEDDEGEKYWEFLDMKQTKTPIKPDCIRVNVGGGKMIANLMIHVVFVVPFKVTYGDSVDMSKKMRKTVEQQAERYGRMLGINSTMKLNIWLVEPGNHDTDEAYFNLSKDCKCVIRKDGQINGDLDQVINHYFEKQQRLGGTPLNEQSSELAKFPALKKYFEGKVFSYEFEGMTKIPRYVGRTKAYFKIIEVKMDETHVIDFHYTFCDKDGIPVHTTNRLKQEYGHIMLWAYKMQKVKQFQWEFNRIVRDVIQEIMTRYFRYKWNWVPILHIDKKAT
jgi:hypothetical protein